MWLIKEGDPEHIRTILAAIEPTMEDAAQCELSIKILQLATSLASQEGARLIVVHAWKAYQEDRLARLVSPTQFHEYVQRWEHEIEWRFHQFLRTFGEGRLPKDGIHVIHGQADFVIPELAREQSVDLVVMGTVGRTGRDGVLIDDTAERIIDQFECSLLAVKPAGFVSPISLDATAG